ncbi:MAG: hypothetical protein ABI402_09335 [Ferruginibacter sp.]
MKKVLVVLTIMSYCFTGYAQEKMTKEQARSICAQQMAAFTNAVSGSYKKGISFEQFQSSLCGGLQPTTEGSNQIKAAYNYLSQGIFADAIIKSNDGKEIAYSLNYLLNLHKKGIESDGSELFGGKSGTANSSFAKTEGGCKWYQLLCQLQAIVNWLVDYWNFVTNVLPLLLGGGPF